MNEENGEKAGFFRISPAGIRVVAVQILFFGLLFLPDYSEYKFVFANLKASKVMYTLGLFMNNPAYYTLLIIVALIFTFSFQYKIADISRPDGSISVGDMLVRSLSRILILYMGLFFLSWLFLTYKLMFMGNIYINTIVFSSL